MARGYDTDRVRAAVAAERDRWNVPGIVVGILDDGRVDTFADGVASLVDRTPVREDTRFRVASITKPFTATLAMTLVQEGRLNLDAPLVLGRTARDLLSHRGGLVGEWPHAVDRYGSDDGALERLVQDEPLELPAAARGLYSYCNSGFWFVAAAIARATGSTFEEAMRERVLDPLGLGRTSFEPDGDAALGHNQVVPDGAEHEPAPSEYPRVRRASGGLISNVRDLLRFAAHHIGAPGPLTPDSSAEMQEPQVAVPGGAYGLGWDLRTVGGRRVVEHGGSALGYQSLLLLVPEEGFALAALTNSSRGRVAIRGVLDELQLGQKVPSPIVVGDAELERVTGTYREHGGEVVVEAADGGLRIALTEIDPFTGARVAYPAARAVSVGEHDFYIPEGDLGGHRLDFPRDGLFRLETIAERVAE